MDGLQQSYAGQMGFGVYKNSDASPEITDFSNSRGVSGVPTMMLVNPQGVELMRWVGAQSQGTLTQAFDSNL